MTKEQFLSSGKITLAFGTWILHAMLPSTPAELRKQILMLDKIGPPDGVARNGWRVTLTWPKQDRERIAETLYRP